MKPGRLQIQTTVALMSALSFLAMLVEIPLFADFLKYEVSDVAALVVGFALGPLPGVAVVLLRNVLRFVVTGSQVVGLTANFVAGAAMVFVAGSYYQRHLTRSAAAWALVLGGAAQVLVCIPAATVLLRLYGIPTPAIPGMLTGAILPFNVVKASLNALLTFFLYKRIAAYLPRGTHRGPPPPPAAEAAA